MKKFISIILASSLMFSATISSVFADEEVILTTLPLVNEEYMVDDAYISQTITGIHQPYVKTSYDSDPLHSDVCYTWEGVNYMGTSYIDLCYLNGHILLFDGEEYTLDIIREPLNEFSEEFNDYLVEYVLTFTHCNDDSKSFNIIFKAPSAEGNQGVLNVEYLVDGPIKLNLDTIKLLVDNPNDIAISLGLLRELGANIYWDGVNPYILDMPSVSPYMEGKTFTEEQLTNYLLGNINNEGTPIAELNLETDVDVLTMDVPEILDVLGKVQTVLTDIEDDFYVGDLLRKELNEHEFLNTDKIINGLVSGINDVLRDNNDNKSFEDLAWYTIKKLAYGTKETLKDYINNVDDGQFTEDLATVKMVIPFIYSAYNISSDNENEDKIEVEVEDSLSVLDNFSNSMITKIMSVASKEELVAFLEDFYNKLLSLEDDIKSSITTARNEALSGTVSVTVE